MTTRLRPAWAALCLAVLAGCGSTTSPAPTQLSTRTPAASATPSARPSAAPPLGIVLGDFVRNPSYTVSLFNTDGQTVASATGRSWSGYSSNVGGEEVSLPVSASTSRIYYLDGDTDVRYLTPDGATPATRVPGSPTARIAFAVSPDDLRIAVAVLTWPTKNTFHERLYVENLAGGGNHLELLTVDNMNTRLDGPRMLWPAGWHQGSLVLGAGLPTNQYPPGAIYPDAQGGYRLVDPATGKQRSAVCTDGDVSSPPSAAGVLCRLTYQLQVRLWSGGPGTDIGPSGAGGFPAAISPSGVVAIQGTLVANGRTTPLASNAADGSPSGWLDDTHLIMYVMQSSGVVGTQNGTLHPVPAGVFVGSLPPML